MSFLVVYTLLWRKVWESVSFVVSLYKSVLVWCSENMYTHTWADDAHAHTHTHTTGVSMLSFWIVYTHYTCFNTHETRFNFTKSYFISYSHWEMSARRWRWTHAVQTLVYFKSFRRIWCEYKTPPNHKWMEHSMWEAAQQQQRKRESELTQEWENFALQINLIHLNVLQFFSIRLYFNRLCTRSVKC